MRDKIISKLKCNSKISEVLYFDTIDSTNTYAKKISSSSKHGTLIMADKQTQGRGRSGHNFESPSKTGLYMTLILKPEIEISKFQMITIADAVAVCLAIEDLYGASKDKLKIKWVNDVLFRGKKISGILTEAVNNSKGEVESVITGIGINISTQKFHGDFNAGAIFDEGEKISFEREELCARIADYIMDFSENLDDPKLIEEYRKRSILTGKNISYMRYNKKYLAKVLGIDDLGGLEIQNQDGNKEILRSGEVFMIRPEEGEKIQYEN